MMDKITVICPRCHSEKMDDYAVVNNKKPAFSGLEFDHVFVICKECHLMFNVYIDGRYEWKENATDTN